MIVVNNLFTGMDDPQLKLVLAAYNLEADKHPVPLTKILTAAGMQIDTNHIGVDYKLSNELKCVVELILYEGTMN